MCDVCVLSIIFNELCVRIRYQEFSKKCSSILFAEIETVHDTIDGDVMLCKF